MTDFTPSEDFTCEVVGMPSAAEPSSDALMFIRLFARAYEPVQTVA